MGAIQIQLAQVKVGLYGLNADLPDLFQAAVGAPFAKVIVAVVIAALPLSPVW